MNRGSIQRWTIFHKEPFLSERKSDYKNERGKNETLSTNRP